MLDFRITLEARNPARRCLRQYRVEAGTDLFGSWVVEISYGRIGTAGRSRESARKTVIERTATGIEAETVIPTRSTR